MMVTEITAEDVLVERGHLVTVPFKATEIRAEVKRREGTFNYNSSQWRMISAEDVAEIKFMVTEWNAANKPRVDYRPQYQVIPNYYEVLRNLVAELVWNKGEKVWEARCMCQGRHAYRRAEPLKSFGRFDRNDGFQWIDAHISAHARMPRNAYLGDEDARR